MEAPAVHPEILLIVGEGPKTDYNSRIHAVRGLHLDLPSTEIERLIEFLRVKVEEDPLDLGQLNAVKNDIIGILSRQSRPYPNFSSHLIDGYRDEQMDLVWRDYSLQHLPAWYKISQDAEEKEKMVDTLLEATSRPESTFAGTALLALRQLMKYSPEAMDQDKLTARALAVASDPAMSQPSRISGIQVAATHPDILPLCRSLAADPTADILLRTSAIGVLGKSGRADDRPLLQPLSNSSDVRLRMAARAAIRTIGSE